MPLYFFWWKGSGTTFSDPGPFGHYEATIEMYLLLRGYIPQSNPNFPEPFRDSQFNPTKFPMSGDPVNRTGDYEPLWVPPGDRRFLLSTGPFTMALGDTQEVIFALVGGLGADRLASVTIMKHHTRRAHQIAQSNFMFSPGTETPTEEAVPEFFRLSQNFPNPFNPSTEIWYDLPIQRRVTLSIYNMLGQKVRTLVNEIKAAGSYSVKWDGTNEEGKSLSSGLYFYRFDTGIVSGIKKMILVR